MGLNPCRIPKVIVILVSSVSLVHLCRTLMVVIALEAHAQQAQFHHRLVLHLEILANNVKPVSLAALELQTTL